MGRRISGSTISMNHEMNITGAEVVFQGTKTMNWPKLTTPTPDNSGSFTAMLPSLLGAMAASSGASGPGMSLNMAAMGAVCVAGEITISKDPTSSAYLTAYANVLMRVMNGAYAQGGTLSEEQLKKLIMALISEMLEKAGPAYSSWNQVLTDSMRNDTLPAFMKGVRNAVCAIIKDPVNANTGNFLYEKEDLLIKGKIPLSFKRFYNRIDDRIGCMGRGWRHNYEIRLIIKEDRYVILWDDGQEEPFLRGEGGTPEPLFGTPCRLKQMEAGFLYEKQTGIIYTFDDVGKLISQNDLNGQGIRFSYDREGRLTRVSNNYGSFLLYQYDGALGTLLKVTDQTGRCVKLTYELGRLKEVKNAEGGSYSYDYQKDNSVWRIRNPKGIYVLQNEYDIRGKVTTQKFADGGEISYDYQEDLSRTLVTDQNGGKIAYVHDEKFRNVKTIFMDGEEKFSYNDRNLLVSKTDKKGNKTKYSYDDKGNTTQIIYPDGEKRNMTYDVNNRLLVLSVNGTVKQKNIYDAKGNLVQLLDGLGRCREIVYDASYNIIKVKYPDGSEVSFNYDNRGNVIQIKERTGRCTQYEYDSCNRVISTSDGNRNRTTYVYDDCDRITRVTNAEGKHRIYEYTKNGKVTKLVDFNGAVTSQEYNNMNAVKSVSMPDGEKFFMEYDLMQKVIKQILPNGAELSYQYDPSGRLEQTEFPNGGIVRYEYDSNGNRISEIDANGNCTRVEYDERNRMAALINPVGSRTEYEYDLEGRLVSITNAMGKTHLYTYDEAGQKTSETSTSGNTMYYTYNELGKITCIKDSKQRKTRYEYMPGGILQKVVYPDGNSESYTYDKNGNLICRQNEKGDFLKFSYDGLNRKTAMRNSFNQEWEYSYDAVGNMTSVKDALGNITQYEYSIGGKLLTAIDACGNTSEYTYDTMGNAVAMRQYDGKDNYLAGVNKTNKSHITQYDRNQLGKIETMTDPLGMQESYDYDLSGRLILKRDKEGYETRYDYTPLGNIKKIAYADGREVEFSYNPLRQLIEMKDWMGVTKIELNDTGRTKKITDYKGREFAYTWGAMGEQESIIYPDGKKVSYEYDEFSRITRLVDDENEIQYSYNENGLLAEKNFSNGIVSCYGYNSRGLLSSLIHKIDGNVLECDYYDYDLYGNKISIQRKREINSQEMTAGTELIKKISKESGSYQYKYDKLGHLSEVRKDSERICRYDYDAFGNRIKEQDGLLTKFYQYNAADQLIEISGTGDPETYQYDARGNIIKITKGNQVINQYIYDPANLLSEAVDGNGQAAKYQYDGFGNRIGMQEYHMSITSGNQIINDRPAKEIDYLLDLTKKYRNVLGTTETSEEEIKTQNYTWDSNLAFLREKKDTFVYLQDALGSTIRLIGLEDKQQIIYGYNEFGQDLYKSQGQKQPFGFTGYRQDSIANTYYAQAREYRPQIGRFSGLDLEEGNPAVLQSLNRYAYCYNNPINLVDLDGNEPSSPSIPEKSDNYFQSGNIGLDNKQRASQVTGYPLSENYYDGTSVRAPRPDDVFHTIENKDDNILNISISPGTGLYVKQYILGYGAELGAKHAYIMDDLAPTQWKEVMSGNLAVSLDPLFNVDVGHKAVKDSYFDYMVEEGLYVDDEGGGVSVNENGDYIFTLIDMGGYFIIGSEVKVDINVTKLLDWFESEVNQMNECPMKNAQD